MWKIIRKTGAASRCCTRLTSVFLIMEENDISYIIRGCIFKVYNNLGPGLLESAYQAALGLELTKAGLDAQIQVPLPMIYQTVDVGYRLDVVVEDKVMIEIKSVENLMDVIRGKCIYDFFNSIRSTLSLIH